MYVTLYAGHLEGVPQAIAQAEGSPAALERDVLMVYTGTFNSMDGEVTITREHLERLAANHNARFSALKLAHGDGAIPLGANPPVQLDHTSSARDTVGRLVGPVSVQDATIDGQVYPGLRGRVRFLGAENIAPASDGRWSSVSIGADLETGVLKELSVTPFPAAPRASLLKQGDPNMPMPEEMRKKLRRHLKATTKCSDEDADKKLAALSDDDAKKLGEEADERMKRCRKYLTEEKKMSEEDADKHFAALSDDDDKKLGEEVDEHEKKLAADPHPEPDGDEGRRELSAKKAKLTKLMAAAGEEVRLAQLDARRADIAVKLSAFRARGIITPAKEKELTDPKGVNLSAASDEALALVWRVLDTLEPAVPTGQFGSVKAVELSQFGAAGKKEAVTRLEAETLSNMPFLRAVAANMKADGKGGDVQLAASPADVAAAAIQQPAPAPDVATTTPEQAETIDRLNKQIASMAKLFAEVQSILTA